MSILEKFSKNNKRLVEKLKEEEPLKRDVVYAYNHMKAVLEDGRLYDTESSEKIFSDERSLRYFAPTSRVYFLTPHGKWFSAEEKVRVTCSVIIDDAQCPIRIIKLIFTYSGLRIEHEETVKTLIGKNDYEMYKKYFGEAEEG
mgnify:FL=1